MKNKKTYLEWDVATWSKALILWKEKGQELRLKGKKGLELGGRNGGISLFAAEQLKANICCSDLKGPSPDAKKLHQTHNVDHLITYASINALDIAFDDNTFDFVIFKSVLGSLANGKLENQEKALSEMLRVLKPGGLLFFAENMKASYLHQLGRNLFVPWGKSWRYISHKEISEALAHTSLLEIKYTGFTAAFVPNSFTLLKKLAAIKDRLINFVLPKSWKYVAYGYAIK